MEVWSSFFGTTVPLLLTLPLRRLPDASPVPLDVPPKYLVNPSLVATAQHKQTTISSCRGSLADCMRRMTSSGPDEMVSLFVSSSIAILFQHS